MQTHELDLFNAPCIAPWLPVHCNTISAFCRWPSFLIFRFQGLAHLDCVNEFSQSVSSVQLFMYSAQEGDPNLVGQSSFRSGIF